MQLLLPCTCSALSSTWLSTWCTRTEELFLVEPTWFVTASPFSVQPSHNSFYVWSSGTLERNVSDDRKNNPIPRANLFKSWKPSPLTSGLRELLNLLTEKKRSTNSMDSSTCSRTRSKTIARQLLFLVNPYPGLWRRLMLLSKKTRRFKTWKAS